MKISELSAFIRRILRKVKICTITFTVLVLSLSGMATLCVWIHAETETVAESSSEGETTESDPPMTGETQIVYEKAPRVLRIVDVNLISNPTGNYVPEDEDTTVQAESEKPETDTEKAASETAPVITEPVESIGANGTEKSKVNPTATAAVGTVVLIVVLITASVFYIRSKHPVFIIENSGKTPKGENTENVASANEESFQTESRTKADTEMDAKIEESEKNRESTEKITDADSKEAPDRSDSSASTEPINKDIPEDKNG